MADPVKPIPSLLVSATFATGPCTLFASFYWHCRRILKLPFCLVWPITKQGNCQEGDRVMIIFGEACLQQRISILSCYAYHRTILLHCTAVFLGASSYFEHRVVRYTRKTRGQIRVVTSFFGNRVSCKLLCAGLRTNSSKSIWVRDGRTWLFIDQR